MVVIHLFFTVVYCGVLIADKGWGDWVLKVYVGHSLHASVGHYHRMGSIGPSRAPCEVPSDGG